MNGEVWLASAAIVTEHNEYLRASNRDHDYRSMSTFLVLKVLKTHLP